MVRETAKKMRKRQLNWVLFRLIIEKKNKGSLQGLFSPFVRARVCSLKKDKAWKMNKYRIIIMECGYLKHYRNNLLECVCPGAISLAKWRKIITTPI